MKWLKRYKTWAKNYMLLAIVHIVKPSILLKKYGIEKVYDDFQDIFTDPDVDIIYLTTPHNTHYPFMKKALENHKHLFVEKSITLNSRELNECVKLAQENNLILAEAMTIWHMLFINNYGK